MEDDAENQRVIALGLMDSDGENSVVLHLFPSAMSRMIVAAEWAKANSEVEHVEVVLHGEPPNTMVITLPRSVLLGIVADLERSEQGITLQ